MIFPEWVGMQDFFKLSGVNAVVFLTIDMIWLGLVAKQMYATYLGKLMAPAVNWSAAGLFYLIYVFGVTWLVIMPNVSKGPWQVALPAAVFGLVAYATYDLTNLAKLKSWPWQVTVIDMIWGMAVTGAAAGLTVIIVRRWLGF